MDETHLVSLSPSRVADFKTCPQLFKFRAIDRLPEAPDPPSARGTLVHSVLEQLLLMPPEARTLDKARQLLHEIWPRLCESEEFGGISQQIPDAGAWLGEAEALIRNYFLLEDPASVEIHEIEWWVEHELDGALLRGIVDRVEVLPDGEWVLSDYKTGPSPSDARSLGSFFGLKFYALVCWRAFGKIPKELRLVHLREPLVFRLLPTAPMLEALERQLSALAAAVRRATSTGDFRARTGRHCSWCPHRAICPAWANETSLAGSSTPESGRAS